MTNRAVIRVGNLVLVEFEENSLSLEKTLDFFFLKDASNKSSFDDVALATAESVSMKFKQDKTILDLKWEGVDYKHCFVNGYEMLL